MWTYQGLFSEKMRRLRDKGYSWFSSCWADDQQCSTKKFSSETPLHQSNTSPKETVHNLKVELLKLVSSEMNKKGKNNKQTVEGPVNALCKVLSCLSTLECQIKADEERSRMQAYRLSLVTAIIKAVKSTVCKGAYSRNVTERRVIDTLECVEKELERQVKELSGCPMIIKQMPIESSCRPTSQQSKEACPQKLDCSVKSTCVKSDCSVKSTCVKPKAVNSTPCVKPKACSSKVTPPCSKPCTPCCSQSAPPSCDSRCQQEILSDSDEDNPLSGFRLVYKSDKTEIGECGESLGSQNATITLCPGDSKFKVSFTLAGDKGDGSIQEGNLNIPDHPEFQSKLEAISKAWLATARQLYCELTALHESSTSC